MIRCAFVGEQVERCADEIRGDPSVRHVADEAGLARVAANDFRPLVPAGGAAVAHEECDRLFGTFAPAEAHEAADRAPFVGRVVLPVRAVATRDKLFPVTFEGVVQQILRKVRLLAGR